MATKNGKPAVDTVEVDNNTQDWVIENGKKRYSDEMLNFFKKLLLENREEAEKRILFIKGELGNGTEDTDPPVVGENKEGESFGYNKETNEELLRIQKKLIASIDFALERVEDKATFGICQYNGELISKERLLLVPHATLSV